MTTASPANSGIEPTTRSTATNRPHNAIGSGFAITTRAEVSMAETAPTSRSDGKGNHGGGQHDHGKDEAGSVASEDQRPALAGRQHLCWTKSRSIDAGG